MSPTQLNVLLYGLMGGWVAGILVCAYWNRISSYDWWLAAWLLVVAPVEALTEGVRALRNKKGGRRANANRPESSLESENLHAQHNVAA